MLHKNLKLSRRTPAVDLALTCPLCGLTFQPSRKNTSDKCVNDAVHIRAYWLEKLPGVCAEGFSWLSSKSTTSPHKHRQTLTGAAASEGLSYSMQESRWRTWSEECLFACRCVRVCAFGRLTAAHHHAFGMEVKLVLYTSCSTVYTMAENMKMPIPMKSSRQPTCTHTHTQFSLDFLPLSMFCL